MGGKVFRLSKFVLDSACLSQTEVGLLCLAMVLLQGSVFSEQILGGLDGLQWMVRVEAA